MTCGQRNGSGVDGIGNLSNGRIRVEGQYQVVAAGGAGDVDGDLACVDVWAVIGCQRYVDGAGQLAGIDRDHRAIGQGDAQVAGGRLRDGGGVGQYAAGFGNGWGRAQAQRRGLQGEVARVGGLGARELGQRRSALAQRAGWEADSGIDTASGRIQYDEAVAPACSAVTGCGRAGSSGFQVGGRVGTCDDGLLQLGNRRRGVLSGSGQVGAGVRQIGAPLGIAAQVQRTAVGQLQADSARQASVYLVAREQTVALNKNSARSFRRNNENLTNNAFDDGNNTAH